MNQQSKIAVIGGTGKAGKYLVQHLINQQFQLRLLMRDTAKLPNRQYKVEIVEGDARNAASLLSLLKGCHAVISTLGQPSGEPPIFSEATNHVIHAMKAYGITRYIVTAGLNVDTVTDIKGIQCAAATAWMKEHYPDLTNDRQLEYELLCRSSIDWTLVRLPMIDETVQASGLLINLVDCPGDKVSSTDLANFLAGQLTDMQYARKAPFIASK